MMAWKMYMANLGIYVKFLGVSFTSTSSPFQRLPERWLSNDMICNSRPTSGYIGGGAQLAQLYRVDNQPL